MFVQLYCMGVYLASAPFLGAGLHLWLGLPSVHLASAAPLRAGFVTGSVGRRRAPL